jgi:DNA topoisomerase-2
MSKALKYDKKTPREHILLRPDTYIGSIELTKEKLWIYNDESNIIEKKDVSFSPGFLKIFDEILVNAADASQNDKSCDTIKVEYSKEEGFISVWNNGENGIPIEEHPEHKIYIPSMIFGELLTGSNFDDNQERTTGGRNGLGSKCTNIFSTRFIVELVDSNKGKKFIQEWSDNMLTTTKPKITSSKGKSYIKITFYPDLSRFGLIDLNNDHYNLFYRRTIDLAGITNNKLKLYFNDKKIEVNNFKSYIDLYYKDENVFFDNSNERWTVGVIYKPDEGNEVISFVNSIDTYHGGSHANHVIDNIIKILINDHIKKKDKEIKISPQLLKENLIFFINSTIVNPSFSSQTKDTLTSKVEKFGSKYIPQEAFLKKLAKCGIVNQVMDLVKFKESSNLKKTDGKKQVRLRGIPKLDDANKAGTKDSMKCSLILTEGDSAKAFAIAGLSVVGRDYFGVFPLKGKLLNVREAAPTQLLNNEEINNIKQIMGLKHGEDYSEQIKFNQLRYGRIIILTDQDTDGL